MTDQGWNDPRIGSVVDEAMKLAGVVGKAFAQSGRPGGGASQGDVWDRAVHEHADEHIPEECRWCPVCTAIRAARAGGPGITEHLMDAGQSVIAAMREATAAYERSRGTARRDGPAEPEEPIDIG